MRAYVSTVAIAFIAATAVAQPSPAQVQFEAGQFDRVLATLEPELANPGTDPWNHFLAIQAHIRMERPDAAAASVAALVASDHPDWRLVGESIQALNAGSVEGATERAERAIIANPDHFAAHYQLGLAKARVEDWAGAAAAFDRATELNPSFAYAAYYAGLAYSKVNRADRTAQHFERFARLAPSAPERSGVQSIMRTLRGR